MKEYKHKNIYAMSFTSIHEVKDYIAHTPNNSVCNYSNSQSNSQVKFTGTKSLADALELMQNGYVDGLKGLQSKDIKGVQPAAKRVNTLYSAQIGFIPNVGAVVTGNPINMFNIKQIAYKNTKIVNIFYNCSVSAGTSTDAIIAKTRELFSIVQSLELKGYRVNLHVGEIAKFNEVLLIDIKIKDAGEHFDALRAAFPLLHPSFLRRICFAIDERQTGVKIDSSYGRCVQSDTAKTLLFKVLPNYIYTSYYTDFEKELKGL